MDCEQALELVDAYALGAVEPKEARAIEKHVIACVRCWEELRKAQRTAALISLTAPIKEAPADLEQRIMRKAARERGRLRARSIPVLGRPRRGWALAAVGLGVGAVAALAVASFQVQMNDLRSDKDALADELVTTQEVIREQAQVISISAAGDSQKLVMTRVAAPEGAWGEYFWSRTVGGGFIVCHGMPPLPEGQVYQAWFDVDGKPVSAGTFAVSDDGRCVFPMNPQEPVRGPSGVGVSQEPATGSAAPTTDWLIWASFGRN